MGGIVASQSPRPDNPCLSARGTARAKCTLVYHVRGVPEYPGSPTHGVSHPLRWEKTDSRRPTRPGNQRTPRIWRRRVIAR